MNQARPRQRPSLRMLAWPFANLAVVLLWRSHAIVVALLGVSIAAQFYFDGISRARRSSVKTQLRKLFPQRHATAVGILGVVLGTAMFAAALVVIHFATTTHLALSHRAATAVALSALYWFVTFAVVAVTEEVLCRGLLYDYLGGRWGVPAAIAGSSAVFALAHSFNSHVTVRAVLFLVPAGVMFAAARYASDALWLGVGIHFGWNFAEGWLFGAPVSGLHVIPLTTFRARGNEFWSGGSFGPEAGLGVVIVVSVVALALFATARQRPLLRRRPERSIARR